MNILLIHHCDVWGGAGVSLRDICVMLNSCHNVTVCLPHKSSEVYNELSKIEGIKLISIESNMGMISAYNGGPRIFTRTFCSNLIKIFSSWLKINRILNFNKYDLVVLNSVTLSWATKLAKINRIPVIMYIRETKVHNIGYRISQYLINKYADGVLFISNYDKKINHLKVKHQEVVRDCLDISDYRRNISKSEACRYFGIEENKFIFLYVGGTSVLKGYNVLVDAFFKLNDSSAILVIAGYVDVNKKKTADNIFYVGKVYDMPLLYHASDVLVFPSVKAHQARPVFEAGAVKLPVIISDFEETSSEVQDGKNGLVFTPCNSESLSQKMKTLLYDSRLCTTLGVNNYNNTINYHEIKQCRMQILRFIEEITVEY